MSKHATELCYGKKSIILDLSANKVVQIDPPMHFLCLVYGQTSQDNSRCGHLQGALGLAVYPEEVIHCPVKDIDCPRVFRFLDLMEAA